MKQWLIVVAVLAIVVAPALHAQDGLRSASLPERPVATPPPGRDDLFRATPGTYRPHNPPERPRPHDGRGPGTRPAERQVYAYDGSPWQYGGGWPYGWLPPD